MLERLPKVMVGAIAAVLATSVAHAAAPTSIETTANVVSQAVAVATTVESVSVTQTSALSNDVIGRAAAAADAAGGAWGIGRTASTPMRAVRRNGSPVQVAPAGYSYPMGTTVLPLSAIGAITSRAVAAPLARNQVVMGALSASLRGAVAGDTIELVAANGAVHSFVIGMVAADAVIGGTELLITIEQADQLGITTDSRVLMWGFRSRAEINTQLARFGLSTQSTVRINRSWSPANPDSTIGLARTKSLLGEFAYRVNSDGSVSVTSDWESRFLPAARETYASIPIRARCNVNVRNDLQAALTEVAAAGLAGAIDVANSNTYGGCFYARFNRVTGNLGFLSRHSWAMAFDTNTVTNAQGAVPQMNCTVVRIFRKHNFAWGGNFTTPDGMHFEWVGERRDQFLYPSKYCPNPGSPTTLESAPTGRDASGPTQAATIFALDGWDLSDDE